MISTIPSSVSLCLFVVCLSHADDLSIDAFVLCFTSPVDVVSALPSDGHSSSILLCTDSILIGLVIEMF